jgi:hypothetical protein
MLTLRGAVMNDTMSSTSIGKVVDKCSQTSMLPGRLLRWLLIPHYRDHSLVYLGGAWGHTSQTCSQAMPILLAYDDTLRPLAYQGISDRIIDPEEI